jgi:hypothetical protein
MRQNAFIFRDSRYSGVLGGVSRHIKLPDPLKNFLPSITFRNNFATPAMDSARGTLTLDNYRKTPDTVEPGAVSFRFNLPVISDMADAKIAGRPVRTSSVALNSSQLSTLNFEHLMAVVEQLRLLPFSPARELFGSTLFRILQDISATPSGVARGRELGAALTMLRTSVPSLTSFSVIPPTGIIPVPPVPALPPPFVPPDAPAFVAPVPGIAPIAGAPVAGAPVAGAPVAGAPAASPDFQTNMDAIDLLPAGVDQKDGDLTAIIDFMDNTPIASERDAVLNKLRGHLASIGYDVDADQRLDLPAVVAPLVVASDPELLVESALRNFLTDKKYAQGEIDNIQLLIDDIKDDAKRDIIRGEFKRIIDAIPTLQKINNLTSADVKDPDFIDIKNYIDSLTDPDDSGAKAGLESELKSKIDSLSGIAPLVVSASTPPSGPAAALATPPTIAEERYTLPELLKLRTDDNKAWKSFLASVDPSGLYYGEPRSRIGQKPGDAKRGDYVNRWIDVKNRDSTASQYVKSIRNRVTDFKKYPNKFIDPEGVFSNVLGYIHAPSFP